MINYILYYNIVSACAFQCELCELYEYIGGLCTMVDKPKSILKPRFMVCGPLPTSRLSITI